MRLKYINPDVVGAVGVYGFTVAHGDVVDFECFGDREPFIYQKALKSGNFVIIADEVVEKRKPGRPKVKHGDVG
jgi:hypothetical protein